MDRMHLRRYVCSFRGDPRFGRKILGVGFNHFVRDRSSSTLRRLFVRPIPQGTGTRSVRCLRRRQGAGPVRRSAECANSPACYRGASLRRIAKSAWEDVVYESIHIYLPSYRRSRCLPPENLAPGDPIPHTLVDCARNSARALPQRRPLAEKRPPEDRTRIMRIIVISHTRFIRGPRCATPLVPPSGK